MKQSIDEKLDELLDINNEAEEVVKETNKHLVPRDQNGRFTERKGEQQIDYKYTRNTLVWTRRERTDAIEGILDLAKESEHPRTYEVTTGQLIKTVSETSEKLLQIQKMMDDLEDDRPKNQTTNQNLFVGSTTELQKLLKNNAKTEE